MSRGKHVLWVLGIALASLIVLAGCAGETDQSLEKIRKTGYIRIATTPGYPPFTYYNAKHELIGFDVGVAREIAKGLGVKLELVAIPWTKIIAGLNKCEYDAVLGSMSITEEREKLVDFSVPYYYARSQVMVPKGSPLKNLKELTNKKIGVMGGTTFEEDAKAQGMTRISRFDTNNDALNALKRGEVDAVVTDDVVGMYAKNRQGIDVEPLGDTLSSDKIAIAVCKGNRTLLKKINAVIADMQKNGTLTRLVERMASNKYDEPTQK